jgi:hypothetical protein
MVKGAFDTHYVPGVDSTLVIILTDIYFDMNANLHLHDYCITGINRVCPVRAMTSAIDSVPFRLGVYALEVKPI